MRQPAAVRHSRGGGPRLWALPLVLALTWLAATASVAAAEETPSQASPPGEPAECSEARALCQQAQQSEREFETARLRVEADATTENVGRYRDAFLDSELALSKLRRAAMASGRAHGHVLSCFHDCPVLREFFDRSRANQPSG